MDSPEPQGAITRSTYPGAGPRARRRLGALARVAALFAALLPMSCFTMHHTVGQGPQHVPVDAAYQKRWFALYGLWPMDDLDSKAISSGAHDYRITTEFTIDDMIISAFTSFATFYRQTVLVEQ